MATLLSNSSGNFTAAATWSLVNATSFLDSETNTTATTTTFVASSVFTPGAITIDGIAIKISTRSASPTGTFSVDLFNSTAAAAVAGTQVDINVSDIPVIGINDFLFLKFAAPILLLAATNYAVRVRSSTASQVTLYRDATAGNWSRVLRTTTTQAPVAGDVLLVAGEHTGAGANTAISVTMNNTTTDIFGRVRVGVRGNLDYAFAASTNYKLYLAGDLVVNSTARFSMGRSSNPIPSTSTAELKFVCVANVDFGLIGRNAETIETFGAVVTQKALLAADAAVAATSLTTNISTGWLSGDQIAIASTTRTFSESENKLLTANAAGTTLTIAALTNAHSGTSPTQGELANLTRNVKIFGNSSTLQGYIDLNTLSITSFNNTEFYFLGSSTANRRGINASQTTGSFTASGCSFHDFSVATSVGIFIDSAAGNNITITNCNFYAINGFSLNRTTTTGTNFLIDNNLVINNLSTNVAIQMGDLNGVFTNNTAAGCQGIGIVLTDLSAGAQTVSGLVAHSNGNNGIQCTNLISQMSDMLLVSNLTSWRNVGAGLSFTTVMNAMFDTATIFGNSVVGVDPTNGVEGNIRLNNFVINAGVTLTQPIGVRLAADIDDLFIDNTLMGNLQTHATGDIQVSNANTCYAKCYLRNTLLGSPTEVALQTNLTPMSIIGSSRHDQIAGNHKSWDKFGLMAIDTTIFNRGTASQRLTPNNAANKLSSGVKRIAVRNGTSATIAVSVRKSAVGDGTAYTGNQPRLILKANPAIGINSDSVLDTMLVGLGIWEQLSGTSPIATDNGVLEVCVDCDGTAGWINIDDWKVL